MDRRIALGLIALVGVALGLVLGLIPVGDNCGSAFAPDYSRAQLADGLGPGDSAVDDCRAAVGDRRPFAYGLLALGALAALLAVAVPASPRKDKSESDPQFRI